LMNPGAADAGIVRGRVAAAAWRRTAKPTDPAGQNPVA
jgi:hypothetical protein